MASVLAWRKYNDRFMLWCFWIGIIGVSAFIWQYSVENVFQLSQPIQAVSLLIVEALRLVILILLVILAIRIFRR